MLYSSIVTGDIHIRERPYKDDLPNGQILLRELGDVSERENSPFIFIAGDLFHEKKPSWEVVLATHKELKLLKKRGRTVFWCRGNHDIFLKSGQDNTIMNLFADVCVPVVEPYKLEDSRTVLWIVPWYSGKEYKAVIQAVHNYTVRTSNKKHYIISHIGIKEGQVTENYWVNQEVGSKDLCPELYELILLGDYHYHQKIGENIYYLGSPIPLDFSARAEKYNAWKVDWTTGVMYTAPFRYRFPQYRTYEVTDGNRILADYNTADRNRIKCSIEDAEAMKLMYPEAEIIYSAPSGSTVVDRFEGINETDYETLWAEFCSSKGIYDTHFRIGMKYLNRV